MSPIAKTYQERRRTHVRQPPGASSSSYSAAPKRCASTRSSRMRPTNAHSTSVRRVSFTARRADGTAGRGLGQSPRLARAQHRQEGLLRDLDAPHPLHARLARALLLEQLALAGHVATVAL